VEPAFTPLTPHERRLAARIYDAALEKARAEERLRAKERELGAKDAEITTLGAEVEQARSTLRAVRDSVARGSLVRRAARRARSLVRPR
ncbi:MAG: hypothetical protein ACRDQ0_11495, partial [Pseudonocardia sp.]